MTNASARLPLAKYKSDNDALRSRVRILEAEITRKDRAFASLAGELGRTQRGFAEAREEVVRQNEARLAAEGKVKRAVTLLHELTAHYNRPFWQRLLGL